MVRSLHCVCDSYNRIHVLIEDDQEASSACQSPWKIALNPSLHTPNWTECLMQCWESLCISTQLKTSPLFLICSRPKWGFKLLYEVMHCKRCHKNRWTIEFSIRCNQCICLSCKEQIQDMNNVSAASAAAIVIFRADEWHIHDSSLWN